MEQKNQITTNQHTENYTNSKCHTLMIAMDNPKIKNFAGFKELQNVLFYLYGLTGLNKNNRTCCKWESKPADSAPGAFKKSLANWFPSTKRETCSYCRKYNPSCMESWSIIPLELKVIFPSKALVAVK